MDPSDDKKLVWWEIFLIVLGSLIIIFSFVACYKKYCWKRQPRVYYNYQEEPIINAG